MVGLTECLNLFIVSVKSYLFMGNGVFGLELLELKSSLSLNRYSPCSSSGSLVMMSKSKSCSFVITLMEEEDPARSSS